jgi:O-antigen ligase
MIFRTIFRDLQPRVLLTWAVLLVVACGGGSSWPDVLSLLYVRPVLVFIAIIALVLYRQDMHSLRPPTLLLTALAAWIAIQLIPLPPVLWQNLPGHGLIQDIGTAAGLQTVWRPISISPDATFNALLACIPAFTALAVAAPLNDRTRQSLLGLLLILIIFSMLLGVLQIASGDTSFLLYRKSNEDTAVGLFSNRNHFALLLASGLPLFSAWSLGGETASSRDRSLGRSFLAGVGALFILVMIIATGSRAGLALAVLAAVAGAAIRWCNTERVRTTSLRPRRRTVIIVIACIATVLLVLGATILFKGVAFERLFRTTGELSTEKRLSLAPVVFSAIGIYLPFGSGLGTFDHMFRQIEPDWALTPTYFNHAHNEPFEVLLTGGLPAALILIAFIVWVAQLCRQAVTLGPGPLAARAQAGTAMIVLAVLASLVDYPLRTPLMDVLAIFAVVLASANGPQRAGAKVSSSSKRSRGGAVALGG